MRVCAAEVLSRIGPAAQSAVPSLLPAIEPPDPQENAETLNHYAIRALGRIGPGAKAAVPILNGALGNKDVDDFDIVIALDGIGAPPVPRLIEAFLRDGDSYAAQQLAWLGPKARDAAQALREALNDKRPQVRFSAADALAFIDPARRESIPVLIEALSHLEDRDLEVSGIPSALAHLGPIAKSALPTLIGLVKQGCGDTDVLRALVQI
jgi:HEAT repeat protein